MSKQHQPVCVRVRRWGIRRWSLHLGLAFLWLAASLRASCAASPVPVVPAPVVLDRVVAVVHHQVILASDVDEEMRVAILDPDQTPEQTKTGTLTSVLALDHLIARALIQKQIRQQAEFVEPTQAEMDAMLAEMRRNLPACVHENCSSEAGWKAFLTAHQLTPWQVQSYLHSRMEILHFIEDRFRQQIQISSAEIEKYYRNTLLPQYASGEAHPPLDQVSQRIQEILLQQRVNDLFASWLDNLRKGGEVEILDSALQPTDATSTQKETQAGASK